MPQQNPYPRPLQPKKKPLFGQDALNAYNQAMKPKEQQPAQENLFRRQSSEDYMHNKQA